MIYNLSIVTTPMQIINSIEAINHFNLNNNILVIIFKPRQNNNEQLEKIASLYKWDKIIRVNSNLKKSKYMEYVKLIKDLKNYKYNYVFFGNFTSIYKIIISNIKKENLYLVDDGTATINIYKNILIENKVNKFSFKQLRFFIIGLKTKIKDKINLFTYFDLPYDKRFIIVKNDLNYFKSKLDINSNKENNIIFLGQPLTTSGFIEQIDYLNCMEAIKKMNNKKIIYIPHRFEKISDKFKEFEDEDFEIMNIDVPVELYFINNNISPMHMMSFCTSATFVLEKMYGDLLFESIVIPKNRFLKKQKEFEGCYNSLFTDTKSKKLTFVDLKIDK